MNYHTRYTSPLGEIVIASNETALFGLWFDGQKYFGGNCDDLGTENDTIAPLAAARRWLEDYFAGKNPDSTSLPLAPQGSEFQQAVWKLLLEIPAGSTTTYGTLAKKLATQTGKNVSAQAIGGAVGHNPISLIIPCHRVIGANGSLTGYAGGIARKLELLKLEHVDTTRFTVPKKIG